MSKPMQFLRVNQWKWLAIWLAAFAPSNFAQAQTSKQLLSRVAVIGASFSAGAGHTHELGAHASLAPFVQSIFQAEALGTQAVKPLNRGSFLSFTRPTLFGGIQVQAALKHKASLVIGLDFLFWYAHGFLGEKARMERLELGLAELDKLPCPILLGDLPDIRFALDGTSRLTGGPLIRSSMLPSPELLAALNERIRAWAAQRPRVTLAPLASFVAKVHAGEKIDLQGASMAPRKFEDLIQTDLLHPTVDGALTLLVMAADALVMARPELAPADVVWDLDTARQRLLTRIEPRRAQAQARQERIKRLRGQS